MESGLILFLPIFMSKKYFWILTSSFLGKYILVSILFPKSSASIFIGIFLVIVGIFYILLVCFQSYIKAINKMFKETKQKQQLAVMGKMSATVGHEIRNPLTSLKGFTQLQKEKYPQDLVYQNMLEEIGRMNEMIGELMILGKPKSQQYSIHNVKQLLLDVIAVEEQQMVQQNINIHQCFAEEALHIECDETQMKYVFVHILTKVIEEITYKKNIYIGTNRISENYILISISNERYEINKKKINNVSDLLEMEKASDFGLGLMAVYKIVNEHQGQMRFKHIMNSGTQVEIVLPIQQEETR